jgi:dolichol-phosphate mannosyltransferase
MKNLIIIPTYNEAANITRLIPLIVDTIPSTALDILVVDDNSPDGTGDVVEQMRNTYGSERLHCMHRSGKLGLASAYITGFRWGLERTYTHLIEMDADLSHPVAALPAMVEQANTQDVVIGSRYIPQGGVDGWGWFRKVISRGGSWYARTVLGIPIRDLTGGFNLWNRKVLETIGLDTLRSEGYAFQIELKHRAYLEGFSIVEYPIRFTDRTQGKSKMSKQIVWEAMIGVWRMRADRKRKD